MTSSNVQDRRAFLKRAVLLSAGIAGITSHIAAAGRRKQAMTVTGPVDPVNMRNTLPHEHILVDFVGAEQVNPPRWNREEVARKVLPWLEDAKQAGCHTLVDCTPNYLGRDVVLLKQLSERSGLLIITNTGYYGGSDHKFLPSQAFTESSAQLAERWINEWKQGIDGTSVRPGFIKISVNPGHLSDISLKLIHAAGLAHLKTGLAIASHTGPAVAAFEQIEVLRSNKVDPSAFIWVHAQNESDWKSYARAAREGAWVSLDGLKDDNVSDYVERLLYLKSEKCLHRVLISHDAGWYDPGKPDGGEFRPFTTLFKKLIPALEQENFAEKEVLQVIQNNPANTFTIGTRKWRKKRS